jgi:uncharacterized protein (TIGR03067 family)
MRRTILLAGVLLCVVALGSDSPKEYDDRTEYVGIEGTWREIEFEQNGKKEKPTRQHVLIFPSGSSFMLDDPTRNPHHLGRFSQDGPLKGQTIMFLYQIEGDTLRIATTFNDRCPQGFNDKGSFVFTYKRVK